MCACAWFTVHEFFRALNLLEGVALCCEGAKTKPPIPGPIVGALPYPSPLLHILPLCRFSSLPFCLLCCFSVSYDFVAVLSNALTLL